MTPSQLKPQDLTRNPVLVSDLQVSPSKSKILSVFVTKEFITRIPVQWIFEILITPMVHVH